MKNKKKTIISKEKRLRHLSKYYKFKSREEKIKFFLVEEYKLGNFYSIPDDVFDMENPEDVRKFEFLRKCFLLNKKDGQVIPAGLFDLKQDDERKELLENIWNKINSRVEVDLSYVPNGLFTHENEDEYELMVLQIIKNKIIKKYKDENGLTDDFEISESEIESYRQEFEDRKRKVKAAEIKISLKDRRFDVEDKIPVRVGRGKDNGISFFAWFNKDLDEVSKVNAAAEANDDWLLYDKTFNIKYLKAFKKTEDDVRKKDVQEMNQFLRGFYRFKMLLLMVLRIKREK